MDRREVTRNRVLRAGTIRFGGGSINCMVSNMSDAGAMLHVTSPVGIPEHFTLILSPDGHHTPCHVMWRHQVRIGVTFG